MVGMLLLVVAVVLVIAYFTGYLRHSHRAAQASTTGGTLTHTGPARDTLIAWVAVALVPVLFLVWFGIGMALIGDPNEPTAPKGWDGVWRVVVLWLIVEIVPTLGAIFGRRGVQRDERGGRAAMLANVVVFVALAGLTLGGGLSDALS